MSIHISVCLYLSKTRKIINKLRSRREQSSRERANLKQIKIYQWKNGAVIFYLTLESEPKPEPALFLDRMCEFTFLFSLEIGRTANITFICMLLFFPNILQMIKSIAIAITNAICIYKIKLFYGFFLRCFCARNLSLDMGNFIKSTYNSNISAKKKY